MTQTRTAILAKDFHETPDLGDAFASVCRLFGHTATPVARAFALEHKRAVNALDGRAGVPVITKSLQARQKAADDHYELWLAMGQMIFGESLDEYEERKLQRIIEANTHAISTLGARRQRREELLSFSSPDSSCLDRRRA
jgi:hypothetical protein